MTGFISMLGVEVPGDKPAVLSAGRGRRAQRKTLTPGDAVAIGFRPEDRPGRVLARDAARLRTAMLADRGVDQFQNPLAHPVACVGESKRVPQAGRPSSEWRPRISRTAAVNSSAFSTT